MACLLIDRETRQEVESYEAIVKPNGWIIPPETTAIHGIGQARALLYGVPEADVMLRFKSMADQAGLIVAHNLPFDLQILRTAMLRYGVSRAEADALVGRPTGCTMQMAQPIVNLPPTERMKAVGIFAPKVPKLEECIAHFFHEGHEGAHDAMVDVRACARVYFHLIENFKFP